MDLNELSLRELQKESARALSVIVSNNNNIVQFNNQAHHNSHNWYKAVINYYIDEYGGLPSTTGPAKDIILKKDV